ncbi:MAG: NAD-dependent epimerase/dehydratase family protein, partial [bacterium]
MKALVTGARGFIGSFLVEELLKKGMEVWCLLRNPQRGYGWLQGLDFRVVEGDITEPTTLADAVKRMDYVFHVAGLTKAFRKKQFDLVNGEGTRNLMHAVCKFNPGVNRFVLVSSLAAAGPSPDGKPLTENARPRPVSHYGRSKLKAERVTQKFAKEIPVSIVRPPTVFGPRDKDVFRFFKSTKQGWRPVLGGGPRYASLIYVKDLVQGLLLVVEKEVAIGQIYYLSNDDSYSWDRFGEALTKVIGENSRTITIPISLAFIVALGFEIYSKIIKQPHLLNLDKYKEIKAIYWVCDNS